MTVGRVSRSLAFWGFTFTVMLLWVSAAYAETTVTFVVNRPGNPAALKIAVYRVGDTGGRTGGEWIPLAAWTIYPTKPVYWDGAPATFNVKVFDPGLIDRSVGGRGNVPYNTVVTVDHQYSVWVQPKKVLRIQNVSSEKSIKVLMYAAGDSAMVVPLTAFNLTSKRIVVWPDAPKQFNVKVFRPGLIDQVLLTRKGLSDRTFLVFRGSAANLTLEIRN
ncbi:MAG: hypothetical protein ACRDGM_16670 [bacterium]